MDASNRAPDFIIAGAQKCGTTSLHHILAHHSDIFIPEREVFFFDIDEYDQHRAFFVPLRDEWTFFDFEDDFDRLYSWYTSFFANAPPDAICGEDSPTYLTSQRAAARMRETIPDVKLLFLLRDPVERIYSHYRHFVKTGRTVFDFPAAIYHSTPEMLQTSYYKSGLDRFFAEFPRGQIKIVFFEDFVADTQLVIDEICDYLELPTSIDVESVETHYNKSRSAGFRAIKYLATWLRSHGPSRRALDHPPGVDVNRLELFRSMTLPGTLGHIAAAALDRFRDQLPERPYPGMDRKTREFLQKLVVKENRGLSELIGRDVSRVWPYFEHAQ